MIKRELPVALADHSRGVGAADRGVAAGSGLVEIAREDPEDRGAFPISGSGEKWQQASSVKVCGGSASGGVDIVGSGSRLMTGTPQGLLGLILPGPRARNGPRSPPS
jgi:hypothetical protein